MSKRHGDDIPDEIEKKQAKISVPELEDSGDGDSGDSRYNVQDVEGQEEGVSRIVEGVELTPFNLVEELEEGHFDPAGTFIFKTKPIQEDSWLQTVDWKKIKTPDQQESSSDSDTHDQTSIPDLYKQILHYLNPDENINMALKRLSGGKTLSASERLRLKKSGELEKVLRDRDSSSISKITELGNMILRRTGNMDIYEESYESLKHKSEQSEGEHSQNKDLPKTELDMFAPDSSSQEGPATRKSFSVSSLEEAETTWELKRHIDGEVEGPFSTEQMEQWSQEGQLQTGSLVRKTGTTEYYSAARIDFDLYL